ncbi:MFS transporter [Leucothrix arctica]|uniref:MFS transporter n=1 Tax=Leucothrix arctica TaxID=1481894 RepID=A0A317CAX2_9GAMM|nr:MFS transporter [Leucothrix arctica]PWQ95517.1 MFS transporter [Leucothrix arctica]
MEPIAPNQISQRSLYSRLSLFYFFYYGALGVFVPYWTVYLKEEGGFSSAEIGELMAVFMLTKMISPFIWGWLTDLNGSRVRMIRLACLLTIPLFATVYFSSGYWSMFMAIFMFSFFWNASMPQFEALTLNHLGAQSSRYSQIRLWGSIGFVVLTLLVPMLIEASDESRVVDAMLVTFVLLWFVAWLVPDKAQVVKEESERSLWSVVKKPVVWVFLLACMLQTASHGTYYTFFSIYLDDHGYSRLFTGWMWALGVAAEVVLFIFLHRIIPVFGVSRLFIIALFLTVIRWVLLGAMVDSMIALVISQLLHAVTFGLFHVTAIQLIHHHFTGRLQGRGQALYAGLNAGLGGAIGGLLSGYAWDDLGNENTFYISAAMSTVAGVLSWIYVREAVEKA